MPYFLFELVKFPDKSFFGRFAEYSRIDAMDQVLQPVRRCKPGGFNLRGLSRKHRISRQP